METLGAWFATEYEPLLRFAYFVSGDRTAAEDLVQETFVRMYRAGARVDLATARAYARTTVVNLARSGHRRRAVAERAVAARTVGPPRDTSSMPDVEARDEMWNALKQLSPRQRACVALRFYEDLSERDIAAALGMSAGSVKKHTDRAMNKLRALLGRRSA
jgi:RNA polymerase sigma-70 factor (sigma-E family)